MTRVAVWSQEVMTRVSCVDLRCSSALFFIVLLNAGPLMQPPGNSGAIVYAVGTTNSTQTATIAEISTAIPSTTSTLALPNTKTNPPTGAKDPANDTTSPLNATPFASGTNPSTASSYITLSFNATTPDNIENNQTTQPDSGQNNQQASADPGVPGTLPTDPLVTIPPSYSAAVPTATLPLFSGVTIPQVDVTVLASPGQTSQQAKNPSTNQTTKVSFATSAIGVATSGSQVNLSTGPQSQTTISSAALSTGGSTAAKPTAGQAVSVTTNTTQTTLVPGASLPSNQGVATTTGQSSPGNGVASSTGHSVASSLGNSVATTTGQSITTSPTSHGVATLPGQNVASSSTRDDADTSPGQNVASSSTGDAVGTTPGQSVTSSTGNGVATSPGQSMQSTPASHGSVSLLGSVTASPGASAAITATAAAITTAGLTTTKAIYSGGTISTPAATKSSVGQTVQDLVGQSLTAVNSSATPLMDGYLPVTSASVTREVPHGIACARLCLGSNPSTQPCKGYALRRNTGPASGLVACLFYDVTVYPMQPNTGYVTYVV